MEKIRRYEKQIITVLASIFIYMAVVVDLNSDLSIAAVCKSSSSLCNHVLNTLFKMKVMLGNGDTNQSILFVLIMYFYYKSSHWNIITKKKLYAVVPAAIFSLNMLFAYSYQQINSWDLVFGSPFQFMMASFTGIGYFLLFKRGVEGLFLFIDKKTFAKESLLIGRWNKSIYGKFSKLKIILIILVSWLPYVIVRFPGYLSIDAMYQMKYYFFDSAISAHHPPLHTIILGTFVRFGRFLGSDNLGQYLYILLQVIIMAFVFALVMEYLNRKEINSKVKTMILLFYCFCPVFPLYATTVMKDVFYCCFFTMFFTVILYFIESDNKYIDKTKIWFVLIISMLFTSLSRKEGVFVVYLTMIVILLWMIRRYRKHHNIEKKIILKLLVSVIGTFCIIMLLNKVIFPSMGVTEGGKQEALSIPFQQTARYVSEYKEEITSEEADTIAAVLDYENLSNLYDPTISDPVKSTFNSNATNEDLIAYFKVWLQQFFKHPLVYVEATLNNNYALFYTDSRVFGYFGRDETDVEAVGISIHKIPALKNIADVITDIICFGESIPIYNLIENMATYICIFILVLANILRKKQYSYLIATIPLFLVLLVCIAGPVIVGHDRYRLPFIGVAPLLICITMMDYQKSIVKIKE